MPWKNSIITSRSTSKRISFKTAKSMANGLEFVESRINLLLDQLEALYNRFNEKSDSIKTEAVWNVERNGTVIPLQIFLGASASAASFEIQVLRNEKPYFAYRTDNNSSSLLTPNQSLHTFSEKGPYPVPLMDISRDSSLGTFNYNFNLNFGRSLPILPNRYLACLIIPMSVPQRQGGADQLHYRT